MIWYLIKRFLILVLFIAAVVAMPFAATIGLVIMYIAVGISFIVPVVTDNTVDGKAGCLMVFLGIAVPLYGITKINDLLQSENIDLFVIGALCAALIIGGFVFRPLVHSEQDSYYLSSKIDKLTALYPYLLIIAGIIRLVIELARRFLTEYVINYSAYLQLGEGIGKFLAIAAVALYVTRTVCIFRENK